MIYCPFFSRKVEFQEPRGFNPFQIECQTGVLPKVFH